MIYEELLPACSSVDMEEGVRVLQLNRLAHLYNICRAELKEEFSNEPAVLSLMHPQALSARAAVPPNARSLCGRVRFPNSPCD